MELVVGSDSDALPAVGFVLRQIVVDHRELGRTVETVFDLVDLRDLGDVRKFDGKASGVSAL